MLLLVSRVSPARDGAAGITFLPLCVQTNMTAATPYSFIIPLSRIIWEFFSFSTIIEIGDIRDLSGFSYWAVRVGAFCQSFVTDLGFLTQQWKSIWRWEMKTNFANTRTRSCASSFRPPMNASNGGDWMTRVTPSTYAVELLIEGHYQTVFQSCWKNIQSILATGRGRIAAVAFPHCLDLKKNVKHTRF